MIGSFEAVLFDWGGTLMVEFTEYSGPMVKWPRVETLPGVFETLKSIHGNIRMGVLTNAADSGAVLVREALKRVGLDGYFELVLTPKESQLRKPDPQFFKLALTHFGVKPANAIMVGDSYSGDIEGAKSAGMRAVWFNTTGLIPETSHPVYDAEISSFSDLVPTIEAIRLPDIPACLELLSRYQAPVNLVQHSEAVAGAAYHLAACLRSRGYHVDPLIVHRGGLLHDLDKLASRDAGKAHGEMTAEVLSSMGWPELGEIARRHLMDHLEREGEAPPTWEQKLVFYADKLVEGSRLVPVQYRLMALRERYPAFAVKISTAEPRVLELEHEICSALGKTPVEVLEELQGLSI